MTQQPSRPEKGVLVKPCGVVMGENMIEGNRGVSKTEITNGTEVESDSRREVRKVLL